MRLTKQRLRQIIQEEVQSIKELEKISSAEMSKQMGAERTAGAMGVSDEEKALLMDLHRALKAAAVKTNLLSGAIAPFVQKLQAALDQVVPAAEEEEPGSRDY
mgnify:CR=1 FL=1